MAIGDGGIVAENMVVLAKKESTYGSSPTPGATDAVLVERIVAPALDLQVNERDLVTSGDVPVRPAIGKYKYDLSLSWELRGSGTVDTAPDDSALLQAGGLTETVNASTDVTYTSTIRAGVSCEVAIFLDDDTKFSCLGTRGSLSFAAEEVGKPVKVSMAASALYAEPTNTASPGSESYATTIPPVFVAGTFTFDSGAYCLRSWSLDFNAKRADRTKLGGTGGWGGFNLTAAAPGGSFVVELDSETDENWFARAVAANVGAIDMTIGGTVGNKFDIDMPVVQVVSCEIGEVDGIAIATIGYTAHDSTPGARDFFTLKHY